MSCFGFHTKIILLCTFVLLFWSSADSLRAQQYNGIPLIDELLARQNLAAADSALRAQLKILKGQNNIDSLAHYPYYAGRISQQVQNTENAVRAARALANYIESQTDQPGILRKTYLELASFLASAGKLSEAYESNKQALTYTRKMSGAVDEHLGEIENNLGVLARRMGNIQLSIKHHRQALTYFQGADQAKEENFYISYNNMGAMMWFSSKTDSALYYYDKALHMLAEMEPTSRNRFYRPANVLNNKAALFSISGRTTDALSTMKEAVKKYRQFLDSDNIPDGDRTAARQALFRSVENLGGVYKELGNYTKTRELLEYSYQQKQKYLDEESPELFKVRILLGQIELDLKNYEEALSWLNNGIRHIERLPNEYLFWNADAQYSKALLYDEQNEQEKAAPYFKRAETLFKKAYGGDYDAIYLEFLANAALFYAENGDEQKALEKATKALNYVVKNDGENTLQAFKHRLNVAAVYYELGRYREALNRSSQSLAVLQQQSFQRDHLIDSLQVEFQKPNALLLQTKAEYQLNSERDTTFLIKQLDRLDNALAIIDRRKAILATDEDINIQVANNAELFGFAKKITLELYAKTGNKQYLDRTIGYHESGIYNRIRARLNARKAIQFADVPASIRTEEQKLKEEIGARLRTNDITGYLQATAKRDLFFETLRSDYPRYYALRYGSGDRKANAVEPFIPGNTTVIRYFFVDERLYALLFSENGKTLFALDYAPVRHHIHTLHKESYHAATTGGLLHDLYSRIWKPFEDKVATGRVIIIPDGELFNLSFETLVTAPPASFAALAENSLLARHAISYQYSLHLLQQESDRQWKNNFIAFAPGFDENLKREYISSVDDSVFLDYTYLSLLPQPFTVDLVGKLNGYFGGRVYTGLESTEQNFVSSAKGHRIIHIGTHAESNNLNPELSRLFFAKTGDDPGPEGDHALYAYEIYNQDLSSNLTLLTACETGKPQHQPGEGMISLAHAFNYAGSQSLLTGLWNIDEKASAQIVDLFYQHLADGQPKDVALQQAKLSYLTKAKGRTAAPEYWAGLIILGDASAIPLDRAAPAWPWLLGGLILLVAAAGYFWTRR